MAKNLPQKLHLTLCTKITLKVYRDGETVSTLRTIAPRDAINPASPMHSNKNLTNQGGIIIQNNTLQLHTIGFQDT
jgi:hypothetical protein